MCGHLLENHPNNGEPLVHGYVCLRCNAVAVVPYRYFLATYGKSPIAMLVTNGKIRMRKTTDGYWKREDVELFLGKDIAFRTNAALGLTFAFARGYVEEPADLASVARKALKAPYRPNVMVIPMRLLKGVRMND